MARAELDVGELLLKLVARQTGEISKVDYTPQKPEFIHDTVIGETVLERKTPESQGVSSAFFVDLLREMSQDKDCKAHKFMALRHGKVIAECAFDPFSIDMWHASFSMCKSITAMAIGILVDEKVLSVDDSLNDIFSARLSPFGFLRKNVTVKNLLTMSSGIAFNEAGAISGNDWRKSFLEAGFRFDPGTGFEYNSMNTYMLSAIVTEKTGKSLFEFCKERIFTPLGIHRIFWESCPQSITKGGWGLFIRTEDMAKLGQLYLQMGKWEGRQIISKQWIVESTAWHMETDNPQNPHYGYQIWSNDDRNGVYSFNGILGQSVYVYPDVDMVIVTNAGDSDITNGSHLISVLRDHMKNKLEVSDLPLNENPQELNNLKTICRSLRGDGVVFREIPRGGWNNHRNIMTVGKTVKKAKDYKKNRHSDGTFLNLSKNLDGKEYDIDIKGIGIFPIMMQVVHNNFTDGIHKISFKAGDNNSLYIRFHEGTEVYSFRCGFNGKRYITKINMHGEYYEAALVSYINTDEYDRLVIRNEIVFVEEACSRIFNICFCDNNVVPSKIEIRSYENPGTDMLVKTIKDMTPDALNGIQGKIAGRFFKGGIREMVEQAVKSTLQPVIYGSLINE